MKTKILYIATLALAAMGFAACDDDFERPPMIVPTATIEPNTSIMQVKQDFWSSDRNYVKTIGKKADGTDYIVKGRVCSSDSTGNIFKNVVIQDETAALTIAINAYDLYESYQYGQEVVVDLTGLKIGGYNGLMQLGGEGTYNGSPSMTFMDKTLFDEHAQPDGLSNPAKVVAKTVTLDELASAKADQSRLMALQSSLVKVEGVTFVDAGQRFAPTATTDRYVTDASGKRLNVRCSSYATFKNDVIPGGQGSVTGILSFYGTDWQLMLNGLDGLQGFTPLAPPADPDTPSQPENPDTPSQPGVADGTGTEDAPYSVAQVMAGKTGTDVWVKGYIVGWVEGQVLKDGAHFATPATVATNLLIADSKDVKDVAKCIPVQLPTGDVRSALNLVDNPGNLGAEVALKGSLEKYFGTAGVKSVTAFKIDGASPSQPEQPGESGAKFRKVTSVTSGKAYLIVASGKMATPLAGDYGYLKVKDVTVADDVIEADEADAFTFTASGDKFAIQAAGKYYYMKDDYNSFNASADKPSAGALWSVKVQDGAFVITNADKSKSIQFDTQYSSYGAYPDVRGTYPVLYEKID